MYGSGAGIGMENTVKTQKQTRRDPRQAVIVGCEVVVIMAVQGTAVRPTVTTTTPIAGIATTAREFRGQNNLFSFL